MDVKLLAAGLVVVGVALAMAAAKPDGPGRGASALFAGACGLAAAWGACMSLPGLEGLRGGAFLALAGITAAVIADLAIVTLRLARGTPLCATTSRLAYPAAAILPIVAAAGTVLI